MDEEMQKKIWAIRNLETQCDHQWEIIRRVTEFAEKNGRLPHRTKDTPDQEKKLYDIYKELTNRFIKKIKEDDCEWDTLDKSIVILFLGNDYGERLVDKKLELVIFEKKLLQAEELRQRYLELAREKGIIVQGIDGEKIDGESLDDE